MTSLRSNILRSILLCSIFLLVYTNAAQSHPGRLDAQGCHHDRKQGGYHCHHQSTGIDTITPTEKILEAVQRRCIRVKDGDTIVLDGNETIRLIGVRAPETKHPTKPVEYFGPEASAFLRRQVEGKRVTLSFDGANTATMFKDKYGRTLAYVQLADGTLVNAEMIRQGYCRAETRWPFAKRAAFRALEREARQHKRGLWAQR